MPYKPYRYYKGEVPSPQRLFEMIFDEFDLFLDLERNYKEFLATCVMLTYQQEKVRSVPYVFFFGDNESGKTVALTVLSELAYRPLYGISIPPADVYGYLADVDSPACIIEDEAQGIHQDFDKLKIYKAGYKQGAVVPRFLNLEHGRFIKYYRVYCFKAFGAEEIPRVKGFVERLILIPMVEGLPKKEWVDTSQEDLRRIQNLRNALLIWRLATFGKPLPDIKLTVKGRLKELWKSLFQVVAGLPVEKNMQQFLKQLQSQRLNDKQNTLEGHIVEVVAKLYEKGKPLPFRKIWETLILDLEGYVGYRHHEMSTGEFGIVTKQKVGYRLREVLAGKSRAIRINEEIVKAYDFNYTKLQRIVRKYGFSLVTKLPSSLTLEGETTSQDSKKDGEGKIEELEDLSLKVDKLSNLVTSKRNLKSFIFELRRNSLLSGEIPQALFNELLKKHSIGFKDLLSLSQSGIMKSSMLDGIASNPGYVAIRWIKTVKIDEFSVKED